MDKTWTRFRRRIRKIISITVPIYLAVHVMHKFGLFTLAEQFLARHLDGLPWLHPKAMGIIVFQLGMEFSAGMAAAGALLDSGSMSVRDVVIALVVGNVLSSPMRAFRHQFPYYAGIYKTASGHGADRMQPEFSRGQPQGVRWRVLLAGLTVAKKSRVSGD